MFHKKIQAYTGSLCQVVFQFHLDNFFADSHFLENLFKFAIAVFTRNAANIASPYAFNNKLL